MHRCLSGGDQVIVLYVDLLFLENLMMDSFLLLFVSLFLKQATTGLRILAASAVGSVYCCIYTVLIVRILPDPVSGLSGIYSLIFNIASSIISYVLICMLMILLAFGIHNRHILMKNLAVLYGTAIFSAGVFLLLEDLVAPTNAFFGASEGTPISHDLLFGWIWFCTAAAAAAGAGLYLLRLWHGHKEPLENIYELQLEFGEEKVCIHALMDTGNRLYVPGTRLPVSLVEKSLLENYLKNTKKDEPLLIIPFHSVGCDHGILYGVRADAVVIGKDQKIWKHTKAVIGIYPGRFSQKGAYQAILHPDMVSGGPSGTDCRKK